MTKDNLLKLIDSVQEYWALAPGLTNDEYRNGGIKALDLLKKQLTERP